MLIIRYGRTENVLRYASRIFDLEYEEDWITSDRARDMILDVDKSKVMSGNVIESPIFGVMSPTMLSGGVKTLILMDNIDNEIFYGNAMGNNCAKWILDIAKDKDINMTLSYYMDFEPYFLDKNFPIETYINYNSGEIVKRITTTEEYIDMFLRHGSRYVEEI